MPKNKSKKMAISRLAKKHLNFLEARPLCKKPHAIIRALYLIIINNLLNTYCCCVCQCSLLIRVVTKVLHDSDGGLLVMKQH